MVEYNIKDFFYLYTTFLCYMFDAWFQVEVALKPMPLPMSQLQACVWMFQKVFILEPIGRSSLDEMEVEY